jgi:hypothetical protein
MINICPSGPAKRHAMIVHKNEGLIWPIMVTKRVGSSYQAMIVERGKKPWLALWASEKQHF